MDLHSHWVLFALQVESVYVVTYLDFPTIE